MPTDASVSRSSHSWLRLITIWLMVLMAVVWTAFVAFRLVASYRLESQMLHALSEVADTRREAVVSHQDFARRISDLERTVYAVLEPRSEQTPKVIAPRSPAEPWQRQRDNELSRRLLNLERWRLEVEAQK